MKIEQRVKFPCGYELEININSPFSIGGTKFDFNENTMPLCPIHKQKCK